MISRPDFVKKQIIFLFPAEGDKVSFSNDNVIIKDKDGKIKHQSTCYRLFMICIVGDITITSGLIQRAQRFGFSICLMNRSMKLYEIIGSYMKGNTVLHRKQYEFGNLSIGRHLIKNKIKNQICAIKKLRIKTCEAKDRIEKLNMYYESLDTKEELKAILGNEGLAAKIYYKEIFSTANWKGRQPRIKKDYINSTLDIGYTILFNFVDSLLSIYDFDTYCGVLHTFFYMRKSLVCDLMEPLRFLIDLQVRKGINYGQIKAGDFNEYNKKIVLKWEFSKKYTQLLLEPILEKRESIFLYIQEYYRCFMKDKPAVDFPIFEVS